MTVLDGNGQLPTGVTWGAATGRFLWNGGPNPAPAVDDRMIRLTVGSISKDFRLRCLKPTVICTNNPSGLPANLTWRPDGAGRWCRLAGDEVRWHQRWQLRRRAARVPVRGCVHAEAG